MDCLCDVIINEYITKADLDDRVYGPLVISYDGLRDLNAYDQLCHLAQKHFVCYDVSLKQVVSYHWISKADITTQHISFDFSTRLGMTSVLSSQKSTAL